MATIIAASGGGNWTAGATWVGGVAPTASDDAVLDATSGNVTINSGSVARSLNCAGYVGTLTHSSGITLNLGDATAGVGNIALAFSGGMTYTLLNATTSAIAFVSTSSTQQTVNTAGLTVGNFSFTGAGGSWVLASNINGATTTFVHNNGSLDLAGYSLNIGVLNCSSANTRSFTTGASNITLNATGTVYNFSTVTGLTINATGSSVFVTDTSASGKTIAGGARVHGNMTITSGGTGTVTFTGNNTWGVFTCMGGPKTIIVTSGSVQTVSSFMVSGTVGNLITIQASTTTVGRFTQNGGTVASDYLALSYMQFQGSARWFAGSHSVDNGNNLGIAFSDVIFSSSPGLLMGVG